MDFKQVGLVTSLVFKDSSPEYTADPERSYGSSGSSDTLDELSKHSDTLNKRFDAEHMQVEQSTAFLDGLRGLAALSVFIQHYIPGFDWQVHEHGFGQLADDGTKRHYYLASLPFVRTFFNGGNAAVAIFFVLSGYVLSRGPLRLLRDGQRDACGISLVSAAIRRPIRLYLPVLAISLITALIYHVPGPLLELPPWTPPEPTTLLEIKRWWILSTNFFDPFQEHDSNMTQFFYNAVAWTLPIELKGSFFVYGLVALFALDGGRPGRSVICFFLFAVVLLQMAWWACSSFTFGLMLAIIDVYSLDHRVCEQHFTPRAQNVLHHVCFWVGWYLLSQPAVAGKPIYSLNTPGWGTLTRMAPRTFDVDRYYRYWQTWGASLLIYACLRLEWPQRLLNRPVLRYLGKVSFMLYLVHLPFFKIFGDRLSRAIVGTLPAGMDEPEHHGWYDRLIAIPEVGPAGMNTRFLLCMAINLPVTLLVAHVGTVWIDTPCVKLGKRITNKLGFGLNTAEQEQRQEKLPEWAHQRSHSS